MNTQTALTNMIEQQLRTNGVLSDDIIDLFKQFLRHEFVPAKYEDFAYSDMHIPLGHGEVMLSPTEEGKILEALNLQGSEHVLEIGTGSGYFTTLLSRLCQQVTSVEIHPDLHERAKRTLSEYQIDNVNLILGDGCKGWLDIAPYDIVVFTGALSEVTDTQRLQVLPGGKLFVISGAAPIMNASVHELSHEETWTNQLVFETQVPWLIDKTRTTPFVF